MTDLKLMLIFPPFEQTLSLVPYVSHSYNYCIIFHAGQPQYNDTNGTPSKFFEWNSPPKNDANIAMQDYE